jgi:hypothetical protein
MVDFTEVAVLFARQGISVEEAGDGSVRRVCFRVKETLEEVAHLSATLAVRFFSTLLLSLCGAHSKNCARLTGRRSLKYKSEGSTKVEFIKLCNHAC